MTVAADLLLENEPPTFTKGDVDRLLVHCAQNGASDIILRTNERAFIQRYAEYHPVTRRPLSDIEVSFALNEIYGPNGTSVVRARTDIDRSHEIRVNRNERVRFRMNATSCLVDGSMGLEITLRVINSVPPLWETLDVEPEILAAIDPMQGMVLVTGETGSGKTTLLASNIRRILETPNNNRRILTYEKPIEFVYDDINAVLRLVTQTEIGLHLADWELGVVNSLRRNPSIILIGESRDRATFEQSILAANSGHLLYTTVHSSGVASTMRRMANMFPGGEVNAKMVDIMEAMRLIVTQRLLPSTDGKRVAVREFLVFDRDIKNEIYKHKLEDYPRVTRQLLFKYGQPLIVAAEKQFKAGAITEETLEMVRRVSDGQDREAEVSL